MVLFHAVFRSHEIAPIGSPSEAHGVHNNQLEIPECHVVKAPGRGDHYETYFKLMLLTGYGHSSEQGGVLGLEACVGVHAGNKAHVLVNLGGSQSSYLVFVVQSVVNVSEAPCPVVNISGTCLYASQ